MFPDISIIYSHLLEPDSQLVFLFAYLSTVEMKNSV